MGVEAIWAYKTGDWRGPAYIQPVLELYSSFLYYFSHWFLNDRNVQICNYVFGCTGLCRSALMVFYTKLAISNEKKIFEYCIPSERSKCTSYFVCQNIEMLPELCEANPILKTFGMLLINIILFEHYKMSHCGGLSAFLSFDNNT